MAITLTASFITPILKNLKNAATETGKATQRIQDSLSSGVKEKKILYSSISSIKSKRTEIDKRKILSTQLMAPTFVTQENGPRFLASQSKGLNLLERLIGFVKYATAGWILRNFPTWLSLGSQFVNRIGQVGSILSQSTNDALKVLGDVKGLFESVFTNVIRLDFFDNSNSVKNSFTSLLSSVNILSERITQAFNILVQPFTNVPPLGTTLPDQPSPTPSPETPTPTPSPENQTRASYGTREQRAMLDAIAWAEGGDKITYKTMFGGGQFDTSRGWKHPDRVIRSGGYASAAAGRYQFLPATWKMASKALGLKDFSPINQDKAAIWLMDYRLGENSAEHLRKQGVSNKVLNAFAWEWASVPKADGTSAYGQPVRKIKDFRNKYNSILKATPSVTPRPPQTSPGVSLSSFPPVSGTTGKSMGYRPVTVPYGPFKPGSGAVVTSVMGIRDGRTHKGYDLAANSGTPLYAYFSGIVTHENRVDRWGAGYGYWIVWRDDVYGSYHFFGHMLKPAVVKKGERFNQGALLGYVGSTGYSTGPHLHWEISNQPPLNNGEFTNREDIVKWLNSHPIKKTSTQISSQSSSSIPLVPIASAITKGNQQTQIASSYRQNSVSTITPERTGQQIVIVDDRSSYVAQQITSNNNEYSYTEINEYSLLNSFIKNKFLLDLNYV